MYYIFFVLQGFFMSNHVPHPLTIRINQQQKNQSKKLRYTALRWLAEKFPNAFDNTKQIMPLSIGIMAEILKYADEAEALGISKSKLREAVVIFTRRLDYLSCLKAREMRIDLFGNPVSRVTEEEAESASLKIKKRIEKSAKNARVAAAAAPAATNVKPTKVKYSNSSYNVDFLENDDRFETTLARKPAISTPVVTIKQKTSKAYDPEAVARLKAKLELSLSEKN